jgi:hypothetical protein
VENTEIVNAANALRKRAGSPPVVWDSRLEQAAITQRDVCAKLGHMDHFAGGTTPWTRLKAAGFPVDDQDPLGSGSEGQGWGFTDAPSLLDGFAQETNYVYRPRVRSHATDLLNPHYNRIGAAGPKDGKPIWVVTYGFDPHPLPSVLSPDQFDLW